MENAPRIPRIPSEQFSDGDVRLHWCIKEESRASSASERERLQTHEH